MIAVALMICAAHGGAATLKRELTPADALATTRIMQDQVVAGHPIDGNFASPDGRRYLFRTAYGDAQRNGVWVDFWTGSLSSLTAATPRRCAHLLTSGLGPQYDIVGANWDPTSSNIPKWVSNHEIAFLWSDSNEVRQVMSVDLLSCRHRFLTHNASSVYAFAVGASEMLLINARVPPRTPQFPHRWEDGFTLPESADVWAVLRNRIDGGDLTALEDVSNWSISSHAGARSIRVAEESIDVTIPTFRPMLMSPNGRYVVTAVGLKTLPEAWHAYSEPYLQSFFAVNRKLPGLIPVMSSVIDLKSASAHPLWSAPRPSRSEFAFSPDSRAILSAPTFLPLPTQDATGLKGDAAAVIDIRSGNFEPLPVDLNLRTIVRLAWVSPERVEIESTGADGRDPKIAQFRRTQGRWVIDPTPVQAAAPPPPVHVQVRQTLNDPPKVWAVSSGGARLLLDPNPHLQEAFKLGRVERRSGVTPDGHTWIAQLIYPADYTLGQRYPLVIQSIYGMPWGHEEFTLDGSWGSSGMGLGPSGFPSYPGQLLASRNIAVLQLELLHSSGGVDESEQFQLQFETVAEELSRSGFIDRTKIALVGFSRNGYWVEYTLAHSSFPFAAAIVADNYDPSYFQSALNDWRPQDDEMNGAPPFGEGLKKWLVHAPGFNADHIHTPLHLMGQSMGGIPSILSKWEIYSRLRHFEKPVEISVMPDINRHPSHNTQNPRQIMAIQQTALDWLTFWLTGAENPKPLEPDQYERWHRFRAQQDSSTPPH
jgi:hypothetical protein